MEAPILIDITIIVVFATISLLICSRLKVPGILGYLITGLFVGPNGFGLISEIENVNIMAEFGVVLLLFTIGLEFSLNQLLSLKRSAIGGGLLQIFFTTLIVMIACYFLGYNINKSIFYGLIITLSSTAIVLKLLMERNEIEAPFGRVTTSILIFQDIAVIPIMLMIPMIAPEGNSSILEIFITMGKAILVVVVLFAIARFIVPRLLIQVTKTKSRELFLFAVVLICLGVAFITNQAGLSLALGAFLAGMIVSETGFGYQALGNVVPFKDVFTGFFFVSVGMLINIDIFVSNPIIVFSAAIFIVIAKTLMAGVSINILGYPLTTSLRTGLSLAQVGEFSFILAATGKASGIITSDEHSTFIAISVITMALSPFLIQYSSQISYFVEKLPLPNGVKKGYFHPKEKKLKPMKDHIIIVGFGPAGRNIAKAADNAKINYTVIEMNPQTVRNESAKGVSIIYGDASQEEILAHAKIDKARALIISSGDYSTTRNIVEAAHRIDQTIAIIARTRFASHAALLKELGAIDVIVEEIESSVALLSSVLKYYYIPTEDIDKLESEIRKVEPSAIKRRSRDKSASFGIKGVSVETITIPVGSNKSGKTLRDLDVRYKYKVNIIAIRTGNHLKVSPGALDKIKDKDELLVTGSQSDINNFANIFINENIV